MSEFKLTRFELENKGLTLVAGEKHVVRVVTSTGKRIIVEDAHFHTDSSMFLPRDPVASGGVDEPRAFSNDPFWNQMKANQSEYVAAAKDGDFVPPANPPSDQPNGKAAAAGGLEVILAALKFLEAHSDHALVVAGHTDRAGSPEHNQELSATRAQCVVAVLEGDRDGYVQAAKAHDMPESDGSMLAFAARSRAFPCDPVDPTRPTAPEIKAFQQAYNADFGKQIAEDGSVGDQTRGAYFDLLEDELVAQVGGAEALASLRKPLKFVDPAKKTLACGERFPLENPQQDGVASQTNRRVELLFFTADLHPDLSAEDAPDQVYHKGTFDFQRVDPGTLEAQDSNGEADQLALQDAPAPENGVGEMDGDLQSEMAKLQEEPDPTDQYAFFEPFESGFPEFGTQAIGDFPAPSRDSVLV